MEAALLTMAQAKAEHDQLLNEMLEISNKIKSGLGGDMLEEAFTALRDVRKRAEELSDALKQSNEMAHYLMLADPYGGPQ